MYPTFFENNLFLYLNSLTFWGPNIAANTYLLRKGLIFLIVHNKTKRLCEIWVHSSIIYVHVSDVPTLLQQTEE